MEDREGGPTNPDIRPLDLGRPIVKSRFRERWLLERRYGGILAETIRELEPDVVLSANTPLDAQQAALHRCQDVGAGFVYWLQDLVAEAMWRTLRDRLGGLGAAVAAHYRRKEKGLLCRSDAVVAITEDFSPYLRARGVSEDRIEIIPNWAPIAELPELRKDNDWSREQGLSGKFVYLYSGTLGFKHDPGKLLRLAEEVRGIPDVVVLVVSEGEAAHWLSGEAVRRNLSNLLVLPFQPFARMPEVLASANVLVAILEADAGVFSVPSKVLTYHCAGRPLVLSVPEQNLAARIVACNGSGLVSSPTDENAFRQNARLLYEDREQAERMGRAAREYAEKTFEIGPIVARFEAILAVAAGRQASVHRSSYRGQQ